MGREDWDEDGEWEEKRRRACFHSHFPRHLSRAYFWKNDQPLIVKTCRERGRGLGWKKRNIFFFYHVLFEDDVFLYVHLRRGGPC
jgi:hypothetical protein